jgi:hypothetical protein
VVDAFDSFDGGPAVLIGTATAPNDASFVVTESNLAAGSDTNTTCVVEQTDGTGPQCDSDSVNVTEPGGPGDPPVPEPDGDGHETAFMFGDVCFLEITEDDGGNPISFNRWGWTHEFDGDVILSIYAGAGRCDTSKGELVGEVTITGATGTFDINMFSGYHLDEIQIEYDIIGMVAENGIGDWTVGPGQYDHVDDSPDGATSYSFTTGSPIASGTWLIVHLVVGDF